jgi:hypothetical protein
LTPKLSLAALGAKGVKKVLAPSKCPSKWHKKLLSRKKKIMSRSFLNSGTLIVNTVLCIMDMHASKTLCTGLYKSEVHRWFYAQEPTREVSGPILRVVKEQVHKGTCSPCSGQSPPLQNLLEIKREL